mmetsp:Transcript_35081/g.31605  ORF Transcript_35081/g.31605 Transcript_35081/m.31605 type:complete len:179 (-) Transcript_35081:836-1372(-)
MDQFIPFEDRYLSFNIPKRILSHFNDKDIAPKAYSFCIAQAKKNGHHLLYKKLVDDASTKGYKLESSAEYDPDWYKTANTKHEEEFQRLENELKLHRTNNIAPSIQASCIELAKLFMNAGDYKMFEQYVLSSRQVQAINLESLFFYKVLLFQSDQVEELKKFIRDNENNESFTTMAIE